jgi:hypothetical protein
MGTSSSNVVTKQQSIVGHRLQAKKLTLQDRTMAFPSGQNDRHFIKQASKFLWLMRLGLWFLPYERLEHLVKRSVSAQMTGAPLNRLLLAIDYASRRVPQVNSLTRTLAAQRLLARHGYRTELHLDTSKKSAWLTYRGHVIIGQHVFSQDEEFYDVSG